MEARKILDVTGLTVFRWKRFGPICETAMLGLRAVEVIRSYDGDRKSQRFMDDFPAASMDGRDFPRTTGGILLHDLGYHPAISQRGHLS